MKVLNFFKKAMVIGTITMIVIDTIQYAISRIEKDFPNLKSVENQSE